MALNLGCGRLCEVMRGWRALIVAAESKSESRTPGPPVTYSLHGRAGGHGGPPADHLLNIGRASNRRFRHFRQMRQFGRPGHSNPWSRPPPCALLEPLEPYCCPGVSPERQEKRELAAIGRRPGGRGRLRWHARRAREGCSPLMGVGGAEDRSRTREASRRHDRGVYI